MTRKHTAMQLVDTVEAAGPGEHRMHRKAAAAAGTTTTKEEMGRLAGPRRRRTCRS